MKLSFVAPGFSPGVKRFTNQRGPQEIRLMSPPRLARTDEPELNRKM